MIIHPPVVSEEGGEIVVSSRIEPEAAGPSLPEDLWFRFPSSMREMVSPGFEGFVSALILCAMARGENLRVPGELSPKLVYNLREYARVYHAWYPSILKPVSVLPERFGIPAPMPEGGVACGFSGGADSSFTVREHLSDREPVPEYRLSHLLFAQGLDIPLEDRELYEGCVERAGEFARQIGLQLLTGRTNARDFTRQIDWILAHESVLAGMAMVLGRGLRRFFIATGPHILSLGQVASHPALTPLLSTESLETIPHGLTATRIDKLEALVGWAPLHPVLRVCLWAPKTGFNCGRCIKCVRTMIILKLFGDLENFRVFPEELSPEIIRGLRYIGKKEIMLNAILAEKARGLGYPEIARDLRIANRRNRFYRLPLVSLRKRMMRTRMAVGAWRARKRKEAGTQTGAGGEDGTRAR